MSQANRSEDRVDPTRPISRSISESSRRKISDSNTVSNPRQRRSVRQPRSKYSRSLLAGLTVLFAALGPSGAIAQSRVELLGHFDVGTTYASVWGYSAPDGTELAIIGTITSTLFVDVTNPAAPELVAEIPGTPSVWREMKTYGHYAYIVTDTQSNEALQIVDLEDPRSPRLVDNATQGFTHAHTCFIDEKAGLLYAAGTNLGTVILDLTGDPESPDFVSAFNEFYIHDLYARNGLVYAAAIQARMLAVLDVSDLPRVDVLGTARYPGASTHNAWLTDDGRYCLTTDETSGGHIRVFDVADPFNPTQVGEWIHPEVPSSSVHNVTIKDGYAYIAWYVNGLEILDLTDPTQPVRAGSYDTYPGSSGLYAGAWGVYPYARSGNIYVSDISSGLYVLSFEGNSCHLAGTVLDANSSEPLPDVEIRIPSLPRTLHTDPEGGFSLRMPPGEYTLEASRFGYEIQTESISLDQGDSLEVDLLMTPVPRGAVSGHVRDDSGTPISAAQIRLLDTPLITDLATDGSFTILEVPTGDYQITVEANGIHGFDAEVHVTEGSTSIVEIVVYPSVMVDELEVDRGWTVGAPEDAATGGIWELGDPHGTESGTVQPEDDHTPNGTMAWVTGNAGPDAAVGDDDVDDGATTLTSPPYDLSQEEGVSLSYYRWFTNSSAGNGGVDPFVVSASNDDGASWVELERITQSGPEWIRVVIPLEQHLELSAQMRFRFMTTDVMGNSIVEAAIDDLELVAALGRVLGQVIDQESRDPIKDASIELEVNSATTTVETDSEGRFDFVTRAGSVNATVRSFGYRDFTAQLELGAFKTAALDVELERKPTATLSGVVLVNGGELAGATVRLIDTPFSTATDDAGRFAFSEVPIGVYRIEAQKSEFAGEPIEIELSEGGPGQLTLELAPEFSTDQLAAFPNPFRDSTSLSYRLARPAHARVTIFDPSGREVRLLLDAPQTVGSHSIEWDGRDDEGRRLAQGMYFERFEADGQAKMQRLVVLR